MIFIGSAGIAICIALVFVLNAKWLARLGWIFLAWFASVFVLDLIFANVSLGNPDSGLAWLMLYGWGGMLVGLPCAITCFIGFAIKRKKQHRTTESTVPSEGAPSDVQ